MQYNSIIIINKTTLTGIYKNSTVKKLIWKKEEMIIIYYESHIICHQRLFLICCFLSEN
jgi:hypothetical protein